MFSRPCDFDSFSMHRRSALLSAAGLLGLPRGCRRVRAAAGPVAARLARAGRHRPAFARRGRCQAERARRRRALAGARRRPPAGRRWSASRSRRGLAWPASRCDRPRAAQRATSPTPSRPSSYREQRLKVAPGTVDLSPEDEARYQRERAHLADVTATFTESPPPGVATCACRCRAGAPASFGLRRVFNGQAAQSAQRHGHRGRLRHAGVGAAGGPRDRHRRVLLQRQHGVAGPRRRPADDGIAT